MNEEGIIFGWIYTPFNLWNEVERKRTFTDQRLKKKRGKRRERRGKRRRSDCYPGEMNDRNMVRERKEMMRKRERRMTLLVADASCCLRTSSFQLTESFLFLHLFSSLSIPHSCSPLSFISLIPPFPLIGK